MAHRARVTMLVCAKALTNVARGLEERFGIPWFEGSFYGIADTSDAIRTLARMLVERGAPVDLVDRAEALIAEQEARTRAALEPYRPRVAGKRVLLYTGGHKTWSVVAALQELGMEVVATSVRKSTEGDKARIRELTGDDAHMFENMAPKEMYTALERADADVLMSGGRSRFVALKAKVPWIDVNQEKHEAYAGYVGMVELVRTIDHAVNNPMWAEVRAPAPWDDGFAAAGPAGARPGPRLVASDATDFEDC
jgi:nitrogenase molybdenum-iron protein alpha/beta subunit